MNNQDKNKIVNDKPIVEENTEKTIELQKKVSYKNSMKKFIKDVKINNSLIAGIMIVVTGTNLMFIGKTAEKVRLTNVVTTYELSYNQDDEFNYKIVSTEKVKVPYEELNDTLHVICEEKNSENNYFDIDSSALEGNNEVLSTFWFSDIKIDEEKVSAAEFTDIINNLSEYADVSVSYNQEELKDLIEISNLIKYYTTVPNNNIESFEIEITIPNPNDAIVTLNIMSKDGLLPIITVNITAALATMILSRKVVNKSKDRQKQKK